MFLDKLPGNGVPHSYWSKQDMCFDNVVDRLHYRQYFSFPPRKTVKNLVGPSVGGPTLGTRTILCQKQLKKFLRAFQKLKISGKPGSNKTVGDRELPRRGAPTPKVPSIFDHFFPKFHEIFKNWIHQ